jgi:hypothetical protein
MNSLLGIVLLGAIPSAPPETIWLEAEHLDGVRGYCWPMGQPAMKKTAGHWALSGPGWAAEWNQGGESGFLSIATAADDDKAVASKKLDIPVDGRYFVWVRYGDWREKTERFQVRIDQAGSKAWEGRFGEQPIVDEDNEQKLYWNWAFGWDKREVQLKKGPATLSLLSTTKELEPRQIDVIVLTTDEVYRPRIKERPRSPTWDVLAGYRRDGTHISAEPLVRRTGRVNLAPAWALRTFRDRGFLYLWNMPANAHETWLSDKPDRVPVPYHIADEAVRKAFEKKHAGKTDVPIFGDKRIVPAFHGSGPIIFKADPKSMDLTESGRRFARWLDSHPDRLWAGMMNYAPDLPIGERGVKTFEKYRDRYVGSIIGEGLGVDVNTAKLKSATANVQTRRQMADALSAHVLELTRGKYRTVYGRELDANPFGDVISCLSVGNIVFAPMLSQWGSRTIGYESSAITSSLINMRWAFMRGIARQGGHSTATYRSCNFGDAATIFSNTQSYHTPQNILDNYYSVYSGAGMTWYKFDIWYQFMAGSSMFYHEQGFDEYWMPGGTTAAGLYEVQLSPKGKLVDRFLRVTEKDFDRGHPVTPVAFLVDYAHGWEPAPYWPNSFKNLHGHDERFKFGNHERMLQEYFWTAFDPIGPESEKPVTGTNEVFVPGVFGDIFDVIYAYPDVTRWTTIDTYPVVIVAGEIELSLAEGKRLADYVERGGTLMLADAHLSGPGLAELKLPPAKPIAEADGYRWQGDAQVHESPRFRYRALDTTSGRPLATTLDGQTFAAAFDRGQGRLIVLSVPHGLTITGQAHAVVPRLMASLTRGLMPVEVRGNVQWLINRNTNGWMVTLINPAGQAKPQQGITPTDYRENRQVTITAHVRITSARDRLRMEEPLTVNKNTVTVEVPAGGVRIIELR